MIVQVGDLRQISAFLISFMARSVRWRDDVRVALRKEQEDRPHMTLGRGEGEGVELDLNEARELPAS